MTVTVPTTAVPAPAVSARDLWFSYRRARPILRGVSLDVAAGELVVVIGASGGGKTTLLKLIKGLLPLQRGSVALFGAPVRPVSRTGRLDRRIAYIPQNLGLVRADTVLANVLTGALGRVGLLPSLARRFPASIVAEAHATLDRLGIGDKAHERVYTLSGGERQRVAIARALLQQPTLILADEFVSQLDAVTSAAILDQMRDIVAGGVTLIMSTHDLGIAARYADRVVVLRDGEKVVDAPARDFDTAALAGALR